MIVKSEPKSLGSCNHYSINKKMRNMVRKKRGTVLEMLELYRIALDNAVSQPEILKQLTEIGFGKEVIQQGKDIYDVAAKAYIDNQREENEALDARQKFRDLKKQVIDTYRVQRKKAKVIFRNEPVTLEKLSLTGTMPAAYVEIMDTIAKFYRTALEDSAILEGLRKLAITPEEITASSNNIKELEASRAEYLKELGESQEATKHKDTALIELNRWMSDFFSVAKIAMEDNPQLLEVLGLTVS